MTYVGSNGNGSVSIMWNVSVVPSTPSQPSVTNPSSPPSTTPDDTDSDPRWGETSRLNVTVISSTNIASVTIDLSAIGGSLAQPMANIGGNIWSVTASAPSGTLPQIYDLTVNATDINGNSSTSVSIPLTVVRNGDINGNGAVNIADAMLLANYSSYPVQYSISSSAVADVTGDGSVNIADAMYLANYATASGYMLH